MPAESPKAVPIEFANALKELGLCDSTALQGQSLPGGISSDIWRIDTDIGPVCAKRALPKLRVSADWRAPIERNLYEARWMRVANLAAPGCTPGLIGQHEESGILVMSYLPPRDYPLWKEMLSRGQADVTTATAVARILVRIHQYSAANPELASEFPTDEIFYNIRLEPYLVATAKRHPDLAEVFSSLVATTQANKHTLVHGDVSPKNILIGPGGPVFLDAECAWWGDPAFDLAFLSNHLLLKCLWNPAAASSFLGCFDTIVDTYLGEVDWEDASDLQRRTAHLLPGLFLARVDGKSPVEYITQDSQRERVRRVARALLLNPVSRLSEVRQAWQRELKQ